MHWFLYNSDLCHEGVKSNKLVTMVMQALATTFINPFDENLTMIDCIILKRGHSQMFFKISVLKKTLIFTGKDLCWSAQLNCFPVNIAKFLITAFSSGDCF